MKPKRKLLRDTPNNSALQSKRQMQPTPTPSGNNKNPLSLPPDVKQSNDKADAYPKRTFKNRNSRNASTDERSKEFNQAIREIRELVYPHMDKFRKKQFENVKLRALGGKAEKGRKMPYPEFLSRKKSTDRNISKRLQQENELGVQLTVGKEANMQVALKKKQHIYKKKRTPDLQLKITKPKHQ